MPGADEPLADEFAGALDRRPHLRARLLTLGELARALQLDGRTGERMCKDVVELVRDPAALAHGCRVELFLARVLELGEQQLGRVLTHSCLLDEVRDEPQQRAEQERGEHDRR